MKTHECIGAFVVYILYNCNISQNVYRHWIGRPHSVILPWHDLQLLLQITTDAAPSLTSTVHGNEEWVDINSPYFIGLVLMCRGVIFWRRLYFRFHCRLFAIAKFTTCDIRRLSFVVYVKSHLNHVHKPYYFRVRILSVINIGSNKSFLNGFSHYS